MIRIESLTLEKAYQDAASSLKCSVTELKIEVVQYPTKGFLGLFKKSAIIVAVKEMKQEATANEETTLEINEVESFKIQENKSKNKQEEEPIKQETKREIQQTQEKEFVEEITATQDNTHTHTILNDTIMPASFVNTQDDDEDMKYEPVYADEFYEEDEEHKEEISEIAQSVQKDINKLFDSICFNIDEIKVSVYDDNTLLIEFKGEDAALLIGKEGYRYKALSYMIFNWINTKYQVQLRLEIAEFLKNQEESVARYLQGVCEGVERDGRAQTKILDGVLVQIALKELRNTYPDKYVAIRSTRDGMKYIIINDYRSN